MKKLIIIIFCAANIFAAKYSDNLKEITTPILHKTLKEARAAFQNKEYKKACELIDIALANKTAPEFSAKNDDPVLGPLTLQLLVEKAAYMSIIADSKPMPEIEKVCLATLKEFHKVAKGKNWSSYKNLYHRLVQYYFFKKDSKKLEETIDKLFDYDSKDIISILALGFAFDLSTTKSEEKINLYIKNGGRHNQWIDLYQVRYKNRDGTNVFHDTITFFGKYPNITSENTEIAVDLMLSSLEQKKLKDVKELQNLLFRLAWDLPGDEAHASLLSRILNEKKKLETIMSQKK